MQNEKMNPQSATAATLGFGSSNVEQQKVAGTFKAECWKVLDCDLAAAQATLDKLIKARAAPVWKFWRKWAAARLQAAFDAFPRELAWSETYNNVVTTVGGNYLLDNGMAGSGFTAAFYMGLISSVSYSSTPVIGDTAASHSTWTEAGATNAPNYTIAGGSATNRATCAWSAAASKSKALSAALAFTFTASGTVKGSFLSTIQTKDTATGTLFSAGLFTGGDQPVVSTNVVNVSYTLSV